MKLNIAKDIRIHQDEHQRKFFHRWFLVKGDIKKYRRNISFIELREMEFDSN